MAWRNLIEGHPRNISTKLFENRLTSLKEDFKSFFRLVTIVTRMLQLKEFGEVIERMLSVKFQPNWPTGYLEENVDGRMTESDHNKL